MPFVYPDSTAFASMADSLVQAAPPVPVVEKPAFMDGILSGQVLVEPGDSTVIVGILVGLAVLLMLFTRGVKRTLKTYRGELWSLRRRRNVFDAETGVSIPVAMLLALTFVVFSTTDIYLGLTPFEGLNLSSYFQIMALCAGFYVFKLVAYSCVGYAFAVAPGGRQWITGFNAAMAYIGIALVIPTFIALYIDAAVPYILPYCITVWIIGQIIFICKGFRIFYRDYSSILYFFLYLCSLEIIPLFALASGVYAILNISAA